MGCLCLFAHVWYVALMLFCSWYFWGLSYSITMGGISVSGVSCMILGIFSNGNIGVAMPPFQIFVHFIASVYPVCISVYLDSSHGPSQ